MPTDALQQVTLNCYAGLAAVYAFHKQLCNLDAVKSGRDTTATAYFSDQS